MSTLTLLFNIMLKVLAISIGKKKKWKHVDQKASRFSIQKISKKSTEKNKNPPGTNEFIKVTKYEINIKFNYIPIYL